MIYHYSLQEHYTDLGGIFKSSWQLTYAAGVYKNISLQPGIITLSIL